MFHIVDIYRLPHKDLMQECAGYATLERKLPSVFYPGKQCWFTEYGEQNFKAAIDDYLEYLAQRGIILIRIERTFTDPTEVRDEYQLVRPLRDSEI